MKRFLAGTILASIALGGCVGVASSSSTETPARILIAGTEIYPESLTSDVRGNIYVGSNGGTIYRAVPGASQAAAWIVPDAHNGLQSLFGVLADDVHDLLWTCSNPAFGGPPDPNAAPAAVKAFSLSSGELFGSWDFPSGKPATCNDIAIAADGTAFATEITSGRLFRLTWGSDALELFAEGEDLVGVDGIAFADDGTMYINNVRQNLVQRVNRRADGSYAGLTTLELSQPVAGPDGLRPIGGHRFLQAEGGSGRIALIAIDGDRAQVTTITDQFDSVAAVTSVGSTGYSAEGKISYRFDPALQGQDPGEFYIEGFPLPPLD
ncbi:hypothetical protein GCM10009127_12790 [Alteraurantiacibacter aestuarii]|uniref:SMP-30/Gluconolactonase/LRE-like region domain-containing protein n=1 Tax=Alteraurantiacibacter aestuarii TaxID=650004 RepID=A0A844ZLF8_9SPHN|nr:hypothetical protein [Alteraurantiacibacter aestuarii]MXO88132.1 hypothetical protein [Alteraurantiacibacter aestuarii]